MQIQSLELNHFRNYESLHMRFDSGTTILYGDNAQGKTNILEAIYLSATSKSHRGSIDREMIKFSEEEAHIRTQVVKTNVVRSVDIHLRKNRSKGIAIDKIPIKKTAELFGLINVVLFSPEDLSIIKNGPAERRRFIDLELCQLNRLYVHNYTNYQRVLKQRNNLLKQIPYKPELKDTLDVWDQQLLNYGGELIRARAAFVEQLNEILAEVHHRLSGGKEALQVQYDANVIDTDFAMALAAKKDQDIKYQTTQVGPHRDDLSFYVNDIEVRKYGSQGQQRTAALSLKLAEIELVKRMTKDTPILLLDDVMSELDSGRRQQLLDSIHDIQTIITCTGYDDFIQRQLKINRIYRVAAGKVYPEGSNHALE